MAAATRAADGNVRTRDAAENPPRSFAELWRLKVHYRAPPDVRGSGRERGHGTELAQCPKCGKALKPGKHHVGCAAGRTAPRQASKRSRANSANEKVIAAAAASALAAVAAGDGDAAPEAPLGDGVTNEYGLPQFAAPPASAPPIGAPQLQPLPQLRPSQQQHHHHHHQQQLLPPPSPISAMLLQHGCRPAAQPGTPMLGDCGAGMPPRGMHHGSTASLEGEDLPDIFDGMENWALRVPSPPPPSQLLPAAPAAAAAVAARGGGRLFDFAQFQQPLPPAPAAHAALPAFEEERLGAVWGHDLTYEAKTDGDVMHLLFGAPDCPPEMATIHLHQFTDGPEAGAAIAAQGGGAYGGSSPFPPGSPFDWGGGDLLQQPLLQQQQQQQQQQHRAAAPPPLPGLPLLLPSEPAPFKAEPASGGSSCSAGTALSAAAACESLVASLGMVQADAHARHCAEAGARVPSEPVLYSLVSSCE